MSLYVLFSPLFISVSFTLTVSPTVSPCSSVVKQIPHVSLSDLCMLPVSASRGRLRVETLLHICVLLIKIKGRRQMNGYTNQLFITAMIISSMYSLTSLVLCVSGDQDVQPRTVSHCDLQQFSHHVCAVVVSGLLTLAASRLRVSDWGYD